MTLVSYKHNFILLRTRKTAGTSVEMFLQPACTPPGTPVVEHCEAIVSDYGIVGQRLGKDGHKTVSVDPKHLNKWLSHQPAAKLKKALPKDIWQKSLKITPIRNPFHKVLSAFFWRNRTRILPDNVARLIAEFRNSVRKGRFTRDRNIVFIGDEFVPEVLIRAEHLAEDLRALSERLGLDAATFTLPHTKRLQKKLDRPSITEFYDQESAEIVRNELDWMFTHGNYPDHPVEPDASNVT